MYILNEKEYIREILASGNKPDNISNGYLITLIAKYYFDKGKDPDVLIDVVKQKMLEFNIEGYQEYRYAKKIEKTCIELFVQNQIISLGNLNIFPSMKKN